MRLRRLKRLPVRRNACNSLKADIAPKEPWMGNMIKNIPPFLLIIIIIGSPALADLPNRPSQWAVPIQLSGVPNLHKIDDNLYRSA